MVNYGLGTYLDTFFALHEDKTAVQIDARIKTKKPPLRCHEISDERLTKQRGNNKHANLGQHAINWATLYGHLVDHDYMEIALTPRSK